ncbi:hypothetical protein HPB49_019737 [Dermacentor silvarum]|uniref:Uncharacterized protein n=1 Tax=Dermacentor silvarum TaxID=543639 RepID=A0ACB8DQG0_DERSI|nr:hypothetical protein HPB49_019737 [Dermacentor silvarum]
MAHSKFSRTADNSDYHLRRKPSRSLEQRRLANVNRGSSTYVLQGFDFYFLNSRSITFTEPLPSVPTCSGCSVVPVRAVQLPCGHTLCELCEYDAYAFVRAAAAGQWDEDARVLTMHRGGVCPQDWAPFVASEMKFLTVPVEQLQHRVAFCVNARFGCTFRGQLRHLQEHCFKACRVRRKICRYCGQDNILACDTQQHARRCFLR